jgi:hypothetical protein
LLKCAAAAASMLACHCAVLLIVKTEK